VRLLEDVLSGIVYNQFPLRARRIVGGLAVSFAPRRTHSRSKSKSLKPLVDSLETRDVPSAGIAPLSSVFSPIPDGTPLAEHIHPHLTIYVNGKKQTVPALVGLTSTGWLPLHTHDASGTIHVESTVDYDFTLGEFFAVWGQQLSPTNVLGLHSDKTHRVTMTVNGHASKAFGSLIMHDGDNIVLRWAKVAKR
jgi:hypothetical protein